MMKPNARQKLRIICGGLTLFVILTAIGLAGEPVVERPWNIILIMADDLGPMELGCYGSTEIATPNIDQLAAEGMRFRTCWATPVCVPTRVMLMTGRYGFQTGIYNMGERPGGSQLPNKPINFVKSERIFAQPLKEHGYATALAGKWQLTPPMDKWIPAAGFDEYLAWSIAHHEGYGLLELRPGGKRGGPGARYFYPSLERDGKPVKTGPEDFGPDMFCDFMIDFVQRNKERPFFAYYSMVLPHGPIGPTPDHPEQPVDGSDLALKYSIEYLDKIVGRLVKAVDQAGLRERTLIIFTGDNGTEGRGKNTPTEAACRVPLIISSPGTVQQGVVSDALVHFVDLWPTIMDAAQVPMPTDREYPGKSLLPLLRGATTEHREWLFSYMGQFRMLRTKDWLLENECIDYRGDFYFCGNKRDGKGYEDRTALTDEAARKARAKFEEILAGLPAPDLPASERIRFLEYLKRYNGPTFDLKRAYPAEGGK